MKIVYNLENAVQKLKPQVDTFEYIVGRHISKRLSNLIDF